MIQKVEDKLTEWQFLAACARIPALGCQLTEGYRLYGKNPGRYFSAPGFAMEINGGTALACGNLDPEKLAEFLNKAGQTRLRTNGKGPAGWHKADNSYCYALQPGKTIPLPPTPSEMELNRNPDGEALAEFLFGDGSGRREDYSREFFSARKAGANRVWTLERKGKILCTAGAYAINEREAYIACAKTEEGFRGRGIGRWLVSRLSSELSAEGRLVTLCCAEERRHFYERMGFALTDIYSVYEA